MKKAIAPIALILLVFVGGIAAYIASNPGGAPGRKPEGADTKNKPAAKSDKAGEGATFDRKAAAAAAATQEPKADEAPRRPPKKGEVAATPADESRLKPQRRGRFIGETQLPDGVPVPLPELYPFQVVRRTFPDSATMTVELGVKNSSGIQWKSAYVVIRSSQHPISYQFEVNDWQIDEVVGLEYSFPNDERERRLDKLRIIAVMGDKRESALADMLSQSRRKLVEASVSQVGAGERSREGDKLQAPGLLAVLGNAQSRVTGITVQTAVTQNASDIVLNLSAPTENLVSKELILDLRETSEERLAAAQLAREFHQATLSTQDSLARFCAQVSAAPFGKAMEGEAGNELTEARTKLNSLNDLGVKLAMTAQKSKDAEVRRLATLVPSHSNAILAQITDIETRVKKIDPHFRIQEVH
ncbi:hypothetical protein GC173_01100 [bacterium]|nr:hypothetical protein [bacterium]